MNKYQKAMEDTPLPSEAQERILKALKNRDIPTKIAPRRLRGPAILAAVFALVLLLAGGALAAAKAGGLSAWFSDKSDCELSPNTASVIEELSDSPSISVTDEGTTVSVESVYASDGIAHVMLKVTSEAINFKEGVDYFFSSRCYDGDEYPVVSHVMLLFDGANDVSVRSAGGLWDCWKIDEENNSMYIIYTYSVYQDGTEDESLGSFRDGDHVMHFELHGIDERLGPVEIEEYPGYWSFDVPLPATAEEVIFLDAAEIETRNYYSSGIEDPPFYLQLENIEISASAITFDYQAPQFENTYLYCVFDLTAVLNDGIEVRLSADSQRTLGTPDGSVSQHLFWETPIDVNELDYIESYGSIIDIP